MEENNENINQPLNPSFNEDELIINESNEDVLKQVVQEYSDGTQVIKDELEEEEEKLSDKDLRKIIQFARGIKDISQDELDEIREDELELEKLVKISAIKAGKLTYSPKKNFGVEYKKKRNRKNKQAKKSRMANRK